MHRLDFFNDNSLSKISVHTKCRPNSYLSKICLHRINGLVVCSSCEQKSNPPVYAPAPYKETAEDLAMKEMIRKKKEEAPKKIMAEMKQMMVSIKQILQKISKSSLTYHFLLQNVIQGRKGGFEQEVSKLYN